MSLEHQNLSKTFEKMGYFDRVAVSLHRPQTKRLRARKIGLLRDDSKNGCVAD